MGVHRTGSAALLKKGWEGESFEKVTFEQGSEGSVGGSQVDVWGEKDKGTVCAKVWEITCLTCEKISKKASEAGRGWGGVEGVKPGCCRAIHHAEAPHSSGFSSCSPRCRKLPKGCEGGVMPDLSFIRIRVLCWRQNGVGWCRKTS